MSRSLTRTILPFVTLTYLISWTCFGGGWLVAGRPDTLAEPAMYLAILIGSFGPGIAAAILLGREGKVALKNWLRRFIKIRFSWNAYAAALLPLPLLVLLLTLLLGYKPSTELAAEQPKILFYLTIFPVAIMNGLVTAITGAGPLGEEGGWRGYLLPRLLERLGEWPASALLGVIWSFWHLPAMLMFDEWRGNTSFAFYLPVYTLGLIALAYSFTKIWRWSGGSILICIWFHGLVNALGGVAFNLKFWDSGWSEQAAVSHFALAFWIVAILLTFVPDSWFMRD